MRDSERLYHSGGGTAEYLDENDLTDIKAAIHKCEICFSSTNNKYFFRNGELQFDVRNSVQYAIFLYYLSNCLYMNGKEEKATEIYYLNKILHSLEIFYAVELPSHFTMEHPLGSVFGRAEYGDYFSFYQGCTVGGNYFGDELYYPVIGDYVAMYSNSKILGKSHIGNHCIIAANTYIINTDIPDYSIVFGQYPDLVIKDGCRDRILQAERLTWKI